MQSGQRVVPSAEGLRIRGNLCTVLHVQSNISFFQTFRQEQQVKQRRIVPRHLAAYLFVSVSFPLRFLLFFPTNQIFRHRLYKSKVHVDENRRCNQVADTRRHQQSLNDQLAFQLTVKFNFLTVQSCVLLFNLVILPGAVSLGDLAEFARRVLNDMVVK